MVFTQRFLEAKQDKNEELVNDTTDAVMDLRSTFINKKFL